MLNFPFSYVYIQDERQMSQVIDVLPEVIHRVQIYNVSISNGQG